MEPWINFGHEIIYEELYSKGNQQELPWISQFGKEAVGGGGLLPSVPGQGQSCAAFVDKRLFQLCLTSLGLLLFR